MGLQSHFRKLAYSGLASLLMVSQWARAEPLVIRASIPIIPGTSDKPGAPIFKFIEAMNEVDPEVKITVESFPFARSLENVALGKYDMNYPMLRPPFAKPEDLPYAFSAQVRFVVFVLYTNKKRKDIKPEELISNPKKYKFETHTAMKEAAEITYGFKTSANHSVESSLKKLHAGKIDGYIFAMEDTDVVLRKMPFKNDIQRTLWKKYDDHIIIPKSHVGGPVDKKLREIIAKLEASGKLEELHSKIHLDFHPNLD